jgi:hypothetical protein
LGRKAQDGLDGAVGGIYTGNVEIENEFHFQLAMAAPCSLRCRIIRALRRTHLAFGLIGIIYFTLLGVTGVALNHREGLGLESRTVSRRWLPNSYRLDDGGEVRADIVVGDLHSGLIFGRAGAPILDVVAALWFLSLLSGLSLAFMTRSQRRVENGKGTIPFPVDESSDAESPQMAGTGSAARRSTSRL